MSDVVKLIKKWIYRFSRFTIIGTAVWLMNTILYFLLFRYFGIWTWFITLLGGPLEFAIITVFNKTGKGNMFDRPKNKSCNDDQTRTE